MKELHAHLNGSISQTTLNELFEYHQANGIELGKTLDLSILKKKYFLLPEYVY